MTGSIDPALFIVVLSPLEIFLIGLSAYAAYRAFAIRRASLVPTHRYQALWAGASGLYWTILFALYLPSVIGVLYPAQMHAMVIPLGILSIAVVASALIFTAAWTAAIVPIARNSDPRNRDWLRWKYLRLVFWGTVLAGVAISVYVLVPSIIDAGASSTFGLLSFEILYLAEDSLLYITIAVIAIAILIVCRHQSSDQLLRRHLKWLVAYFVVLFFTDLVLFVDLKSGTLASTLAGSVTITVFVPFIIVASTVNFFQAFCTYMCVRSLAPINRFPPKQLVESKR
jgi:hypothetical protein